MVLTQRESRKLSYVRFSIIYMVNMWILLTESYICIYACCRHMHVLNDRSDYMFMLVN